MIVRIKTLQFSSSHLFVLLLSISAHLGLGFVLGNGGHAESGVASSAQKTTATMVELLQVSGNAAEASPVTATPNETDDLMHFPASAAAGRQGEFSAKSTGSPIDVAPVPMQKPGGEAPIFPVVMPPEPYYFLVDELTENPRVEVDISPELVFFVPNGMSQLAILRLLINEQGDVDQVMVEGSALPKETQHLMIDAFSKTKFQPGKIDGISVKSELEIEVALGNYGIGKSKRDAGPAPVVSRKLE